VRARPAGAEHDELAAAVKAHGHRVAGGGDRLGLAGQVPQWLVSAGEQPGGFGAVACGPAGGHRAGRGHDPWPPSGAERSTSTSTSTELRTLSAPKNPVYGLIPCSVCTIDVAAW